MIISIYGCHHGGIRFLFEFNENSHRELYQQKEGGARAGRCKWPFGSDRRNPKPLTWTTANRFPTASHCPQAGCRRYMESAKMTGSGDDQDIRPAMARAELAAQGEIALWQRVIADASEPMGLKKIVQTNKRGS